MMVVWKDSQLSQSLSVMGSLINIDGAVVEQVECFKFPGVHITNNLSWSKNIKTVVKRARQHLFPSGD
jgi:hypothetical protein